MIIPIKPWLEKNKGAAAYGAQSWGRRIEGGLTLSSDFEAEELMRAGGMMSEVPRGLSMSTRMEFYHQPIMATEILRAMQPIEGRQIFDGTLGGGGHSEIFLQHGAHVVGCDQDADALDYASRRLSSFGDRFLPVRGNFSEVDVLLRSHGIEHVDGILLDLGVSSHQLDEPDRGFSFREDGPLDMRMDDRSSFSAEDLINEWSEDELIRIFREYGEEKRAVRAARAIIRARGEARIVTTLQLAAAVEGAIPRTGRKHPATKVFQAVRIAVNRELDCLEIVLDKAVDALAEGGVLAVITFHSLEDRMVKHFMRRKSSPFIDRPEWPEPKENPEYCLNLSSRRAIVPGEDEVALNPRARSAKLRLATKVGDL